jgi:hypothetical protein
VNYFYIQKNDFFYVFIDLFHNYRLTMIRTFQMRTPLTDMTSFRVNVGNHNENKENIPPVPPPRRDTPRPVRRNVNIMRRPLMNLTNILFTEN